MAAVIFRSISPAKPVLTRRRVASFAGDPRYSTSAAASSARFTSSALERITSRCALKRVWLRRHRTTSVIRLSPA